MSSFSPESLEFSIYLLIFLKIFIKYFLSLLFDILQGFLVRCSDVSFFLSLPFLSFLLLFHYSGKFGSIMPHNIPVFLIFFPSLILLFQCWHLRVFICLLNHFFFLEQVFSMMFPLTNFCCMNSLCVTNILTQS